MVGAAKGLLVSFCRCAALTEVIFVGIRGTAPIDECMPLCAFTAATLNPPAPIQVQRPAAAIPAGSAQDVFCIGPAVIDCRTRRVESPAGARRLRPKELELVVYFYQHVALTLSRETLLQSVWNSHPHLLTRTVDQTVANLRKKIEPDPGQPQFLQTVRGYGYRLVL